MNIVGILGMTHDQEMQKKYQYPLSLVKELIEEFDPEVICGEVHPASWNRYIEQGGPYGILGETQEEYPALIFPYCEEKGIPFVPVNWFEEDVFDEEPFDRYDKATRVKLEKELEDWNQKQLSTWDYGRIPLNSTSYDQVSEQMYEWIHDINPEVQEIVWNARHQIMVRRVLRAVREYPGKRILCIHGADHNYWYHQALQKKEGIEVVYPLR